MGALFGSCASDPEPTPELDFSAESAWPYLERVTDPAEKPDFRPAFAEREGILAALDQSIAYLGKPSSQQWFPYRTNDSVVSHRRMLTTIETLRECLLKSESADEFQGWCLTAFDVYRSVGAARTGRMLFTAYCEPIFEGRLQADAKFKHPLYGLPPELEKDANGNCLGRRLADGSLVAWPTRQGLEESSLLKGLEIVWLADPFEAFIAHVQGSVRVNLPDGRQLCLGYAGKTEHEYVSAGQALIESGKIAKKDLSLSRMKEHFAQHPEDVQPVLWKNPSYVFFRECEPGPWGCLGARVTPYHSVATDKDVFPRAGPCLAVTRLPVTTPDGGVSMQAATCLLFDQDRGGAIRAAGRADIFIGTGPEAERIAGFTQEEGRLFYFFAKDVPGRVTTKPETE
jgi:membrane-bound lytic murein transglycosylase A